MRLTKVVAVAAGAALLLGLGALRPLGEMDEQPEAASIVATRTDARRLASEAMAQLARVRSHADPTVIPRVRRLLERSLEQQPRGNLAASVGMAALANARHDFSGSVVWARRAIRIDPYAADAYGLLGDALFELGRVRPADRAYQSMIDRRPDVASYVRASYSAQHHGNYRAAIRALKLALDATAPVGEDAAWLHHQLGDVYSSLGRIDASERVNRTGSKLAPGYVPPTVGIAEAHISRGDFERAIPIMERAARELPSLEYLATLGDLYRFTGSEGDARRVYRRATTRFARYRNSDVLPDHDFVQFYADHGLRPDAAVSEARYIYADRPTPAAADTLAWALHAAGRDREAWRYVRRSLDAATPPDALTLFHAAAIADALGRDDAATRLARRALDVDPTFSLFHLRAAEHLAEG